MPSREALRVLGAAQSLGGAVLLAAPEVAARAVSRHRAAPPGWLVRLLAARMLVQGVVLLARPDRRLAYTGSAVDAVHALSMVAVAAARPEYRPAALSSAAAAGTSAAVGVTAARGLR